MSTYCNLNVKALEGVFNQEKALRECKTLHKIHKGSLEALVPALIPSKPATTQSQLS